MPRHHVFAPQDSQQGRQATSLLQRGREQARRRPSRRSEPRSSPGRDQRFAGAGLAPIGRGAGRGRGSTEDAVVVSRGSLRGDSAGRLDRSVEAVRVAALLWARLKELHRMSVNLTRDELLIKLGQAKAKSPAGWRLVEVEVDPKHAAFRYALDRKKLRQARRREGRYLLRSNLTQGDPALLWSYYLQLVQVEEAFRTLKGDLAVRPIHHQEPWRIEAHIFMAFLAYCLHVTSGRRLNALAPGLTPRSLFEKFAAVQMIDVHIPTTDGRELQLTRYTQPEPELTLLLERLRLELPDQPPPKITAAQATAP